MMCAQRVNEAPVDDTAQGSLLRFTEEDLSAPLFGIPDVAVFGCYVEVAAQQNLLLWRKAVEKPTQAAIPLEFVAVLFRSHFLAVGRVNVENADALHLPGEETALGIGQIVRQATEYIGCGEKR